MADFLFNIAKGRFVEFFNRVDTNDPANSAIIVVPVDVAAVSDATIKDFDTLSAVLAGGVTERSATGWNRKTLTDADLGAFAPDDPNDWFAIDGPDLTWTGVTAGNVTDLLFCYDSDTTAGTDANIIPIFQYDFPITPDGSDILAQVHANGLARAT